MDVFHSLRKVQTSNFWFERNIAFSLNADGGGSIQG